MRRKISIAITLVVLVVVVGYLMLVALPAVAPTPTPALVKVTATLAFITPTPSLTPTATQTQTFTATPTTMPTSTASQSPTATPTQTIAVTLTSALSPNAWVKAEWTALNLRVEPGLDSAVLTRLDRQTPLVATGRTADGAWLQVTTLEGLAGWVMAEYVDLTVDAASLPVTSGYAEIQTQTPTITATPAPRLILNITANAHAIFERGQQLGNRSNVFSKVGDSITWVEHFLYPIGRGEYNLREYSDLQPVIDFYSAATARTANSFANESIAAVGGWTTRELLNPNAVEVQGACQPGETPLACEYRVVKPAVAIIMIGTNDSNGVPNSEYEANMRAIIETSIEQGVIPVLSTLPPKGLPPSVDPNIVVMNDIIARLALEYDIPYMDYWAAMVELPDTGLWHDTVHPSYPPDNEDGVTDFTRENLQAGFTVRNLLTLQTLDALWRAVINPALPPPASAGLPVESVSVDAGFSCPGAPPPRLVVNGNGHTLVELNVRTGPDDTYDRVGKLPVGATFRVLSGPVCTEGLTWWQVDAGGMAGWVASGLGDEYWVAP